MENELQTVDLSQVKDVARLKDMYIQFNEDLTVANANIAAAQNQGEIAAHNLQSVRNRLVELKVDLEKANEAAAQKAEKDTAANASRRERRAAQRKASKSKTTSKSK